jgi:hypothetical protein
MASATPAVIPVAGPNSTTGAVAGQPVIALGANINGGWITNPSTATATLYVDPTGNAPNLSVGGTTFAIYPGDTYTAIPGQTTVTQVVSSDANHVFTSVQW